MWDIEVSLDGNPFPFKMCRCLTPEIVSAIVLALCKADEMQPIIVRPVPPDAPREVPGMGAFTGGP